MTRVYGWGPTDERLVRANPFGHWMTTTFVGALRSTGLVAPMVVNGPINGDVFRAYVEQQLVRVLKPGDIVVMDNLSSHKVKGVAEAIRGAGAELLYLPPYSPDLNPIERWSSPRPSTSSGCANPAPARTAKPSAAKRPTGSSRRSASTTSDTPDTFRKKETENALDPISQVD